MAPTNVKELEGKYLTFSLDNEEYAINILKIVEIVTMVEVTPVPNTPDFILGIINLRHKIIPIIDLRMKFGLTVSDQTNETCIVIVNTHELSLGMVVDKVSEVIQVKGDSIENVNALGANVNTRFIMGLAKIENNVSILLDIDKILSHDEIITLQEHSEE